jgi:hypothetical protein
MKMVLTLDFERKLTMSKLKVIFIFGLLTVALAGCMGTTTGNGIFPADGHYGPGTSVPQVYMTPNGDRVGHYPPYFYPDGSGTERR